MTRPFWTGFRRIIRIRRGGAAVGGGGRRRRWTKTTSFGFELVCLVHEERLVCRSWYLNLALPLRGSKRGAGAGAVARKMLRELVSTVSMRGAPGAWQRASENHPRRFRLRVGRVYRRNGDKRSIPMKIRTKVRGGPVVGGGGGRGCGGGGNPVPQLPVMIP